MMLLATSCSIPAFCEVHNVGVRFELVGFVHQTPTPCANINVFGWLGSNTWLPFVMSELVGPGKPRDVSCNPARSPLNVGPCPSVVGADIEIARIDAKDDAGAGA